MYKRIFLIIFVGLVFAGSIFVKPNKTFAFGGVLPFGGLVTLMTTPSVICPGVGPMTIKPVGNYPVTKYLKLGSSAFSSTRTGNWVLGLYNPIIAPMGCFIGEDPYPTYNIGLFGSSSQFSF